MDATCESLTVDEIVEINRRKIEFYGGIFNESCDNFLNKNSLLFILGEIHEIRFGAERYPTIIDKAAAVGWHIMAGHVFHDGCKRTGTEACRIILALNGFIMYIAKNEPDEELIDITERIADTRRADRVSLEEFMEWVRQRTTKRENNENG